MPPVSVSPSDVVSVVFSANDYYAPYLATLLVSLLDHCSPARIYEFTVLTEDMRDKSMGLLRELVATKGHTIQFVNVSQAMQPYQSKLRVYAHFKVETYFRLLLPQILPQAHKVLYLDADMVCLRDVAELFDTNIEGYLVAACKDPDTTGLYNGSPLDVGVEDYRSYMDNVLQIKDPFSYFQAGTILFNLDEWRRSIDVEEVFRFAQSYSWHLLDQDVLNYFCQDRVRHVDMAWNVMYDFDDIRIDQIISYTTPELFAEYQEARTHPAIVHYAGPRKPWDDPTCDYGKDFWHYARQTPYYEAMLYRAQQEQQERELAQQREQIRALQQSTNELWQRLEVAEHYLHAVDDELQRFEHRSLALMAKELVYQKMLTPAAHLIAQGSPQAFKHVRALYRKIHPSRQD